MDNLISVPMVCGWNFSNNSEDELSAEERRNLVPIDPRDSYNIQECWSSCLCAVSQALVGGEDWNHDPLEVFVDWFLYDEVSNFDISHATSEILEQVRFTFSRLIKICCELAEKHGAIPQEDESFLHAVWDIAGDAMRCNSKLLIVAQNLPIKVSVF